MILKAFPIMAFLIFFHLHPDLDQVCLCAILLRRSDGVSINTERGRRGRNMIPYLQVALLFQY